MAYYQKINNIFVLIFLIFFSSSYLIANVQVKEKDKIVLIEEIDCKQEVIIDDDKTNLKNKKDFSVKLLDKDNICSQSSSNQSSNNIPSSNVAASNAAQAMMNEDGQNSGNNTDKESSDTSSDNSDTSLNSSILSPKMKDTDLPSKRCIQKYNLNSEVQMALIDEIEKTNNEEDKNSLIKELSNRSNLTIDELNEECFNN